MTIVIYHANCFDGMASAWVLNLVYPDAKFIPANYGDMGLITSLQQDCFENANINDDYILVDFSFPKDLMIQMASKAKSMLVLDHHKTAQVACEGLDFCVFDMNESGASLAWRHYFADKPMPRLIRYIKDRDLWLFKEHSSREINAYIQSYEMTIAEYDKVNNILESDEGFALAFSGGASIERFKSRITNTKCSNAMIVECAGYKVPIINSGGVLMAEIGERLLQLHPDAKFSMSYFITPKGDKIYSLRSRPDFDVSEVAKQFGGGGHAQAAGFQGGMEI